MPNKDRSPINYRISLRDTSDDDLALKFGVYMIAFFGVLVILIGFYILSYYCCGGKSGILDEEDERRGRNKMLLFHYENRKWPEKSKSKTLRIDEIKQQENQIRTILATK